MKRKKILYIHHAGELGGAPKSLSILLNGLDKKLFESTVFMLIDGPAKALFENVCDRVIVSKMRLFAFHGTTVSGMSFRLFVKNLLFIIPNAIAAYRVIKKTKPQLIHLNTSCLFIYALIAKLFFKNINVVCHVREPILNNFYGNILKVFNNKYCEFFIPINEYEAEPFKKNKHKVIRNSIDTSLYCFNHDIRAEQRKNYGISDSDFVIGYFARFNLENGIQDLLSLANALNPDIKILVFGYEPKSLYQKEIDIANKMPNNVILNGMTSDVNIKMQMIDLLLSPFKTPHFSRAMIEAQSLSIPVIASNIGSQNTLLRDGETGYLYEVGAIQDLKNKIIFLKSNKEILSKMKFEARNFALDMFDQSKNNEIVYSIYNDLLRIKC